LVIADAVVADAETADVVATTCDLVCVGESCVGGGQIGEVWNGETEVRECRMVRILPVIESLRITSAITAL
jgi:hypothetical protein